MKSELISARLKKEEVAILDEVSKEEKTDKTTALRKIFALGAKEYMLEKAITQYQQGKISIGKAAEKAGISLWEMMDKLKEKNIANPLSEEDFRESLKNLEKAWK